MLDAVLVRYGDSGGVVQSGGGTRVVDGWAKWGCASAGLPTWVGVFPGVALQPPGVLPALPGIGVKAHLLLRQLTPLAAKGP